LQHNAEALSRLQGINQIGMHEHKQHVLQLHAAVCMQHVLPTWLGV
jgi:hypothetical protein